MVFTIKTTTIPYYGEYCVAIYFPNNKSVSKHTPWYKKDDKYNPYSVTLPILQWLYKYETNI